MRTRIKICGITRPEDALTAAMSGADAIGLVFYAESPRSVTINKAKEIISVLPPFVSRVGLFVNAGGNEINTILTAVPLDLLQFHGDEKREECNAYFKPYIKAVRMNELVNLKAITGEYPDATAFLLDTYVKGKKGGTGQTFDWSRIPRDLDRPVILAGGLTPENVGDAVRQVSPWAVDVSGGVESEKGIKDRDKITKFIKEVRSAKD